MSDVVTINGKEYKIGEVVKSEYYHKDEFNDLVLNGFTVKVGDTWLTRNKEKVKITALSGSAWPIVGGSYSATYSVLGIRNADYSISNDDLETKFVEDECAEPVDGEPAQEELIPMAKKAKPAKKKKDSEDIEELPDLDIEIGDVWLTAASNKVEIIEYAKTGFGNESPFVWKASNGDIYTAKGKYFSLLTASSKDLVTRVSRAIKIKTEATEINEAPVLDMPSNYADALRHSTSSVKDDAIDALRYSTIENVCSKDTTINFENAVKMHMDSIVSLIGDRICEKVKSRDVSAVKYLTKVLEKVIALESL